jgi:phage terminase large subunit
MAQIVSRYRPRQYFMPFHLRKQRWSMLVAHRRAGKTVAAVNDLIEKASYNTRESPRYAYIAPFLRQAKDIAWQYLMDFSRPFQPRINQSELFVELTALPNAPRISIYGADNPDSFRGLYLDGAVLDEFGNMRGSIFKEVLLPALIDRRGWGVFMGTPNGPNHFRDLWYEKEDDETWFRSFLPHFKTNVLSDEDIAEMRRIMDPEQFAQEMECSFEASVRGAIYARQVEAAIQEERIGNFPMDRTTPTEVFMDIGWKDQTTIGFVQRRFDGILLGASYGANMKQIGEYINYVKSFWVEHRLQPGQIWLPHDAKAKSLQTGKAIIDHFRLAGLRPKLVPKLDVIDGIAALRTTFPQLYINEPLNKTFILAAKTYHRKYDELLKRYSDEPVHDWSSDWMDMGRYVAITCNKLPPRKATDKRPRDHGAGSSYAFALNDLWDCQPQQYTRL